MMAWREVETALDGILGRRWYTNHGPLAVALERRLKARFGAAHAVATVNPTIALMLLIDGLGLSGDVMLPSNAPVRCGQAIEWAGLRPVRFTGLLQAARSVRPGMGAVLCPYGADAPALARFAAEHGMRFFGDGAGAGLGPWMQALPCPGDPAGVACVLTDDDGLAARLRNIRSSYGAGAAVAVVRTANGRLSEAQAAMALLMLDRDGDVRGASAPAARGGAARSEREPVLSASAILAKAGGRMRAASPGDEMRGRADRRLDR